MKRLLHALAGLAIAIAVLAGQASAVTNTSEFNQTLDTSTKTSDTFDPLNAGQARGFSVVVTGTFSANWRLQRSVDGTDWVDFKVIDQPDVVEIPVQAPMLWRVTAAGAGDFTSGSAKVTFRPGGQQAATSATRVLTKDGSAVSSTSPMPVGGVSSVVGATLTKSTKTTAYSSGQLIAQNATAGSCSAIAIAVARVSDATGMVRRLRLKVNDTSFNGASVRAHFFKDNPTFANGDAGNWDQGLTESNYMGKIDILFDRRSSDGFVKGIGVPDVGNEINFDPSTGTRNIYVVFEARSTTAGSHASGSTWTATLEVLQN